MRRLDEDVRTCRLCGELKTVEHFSPQGRARRDGSRNVRPDCKSCTSRLRAQRWAVSPAGIKAAERRAWRLLDDPERRRCTKCEQIKALSDFHARGGGRGGVMSYCKTCHYEVVRRVTATRDSIVSLRYGRKHRFGLAHDAVVKMLRAQNDCCAICLTAITEASAHVDHDHATDEKRGLLCRSCNLLLGHAADDPLVLRRAADYLEAGLTG